MKFSTVIAFVQNFGSGRDYLIHDPIYYSDNAERRGVILFISLFVIFFCCFVYQTTRRFPLWNYRKERFREGLQAMYG